MYYLRFRSIVLIIFGFIVMMIPNVVSAVFWQDNTNVRLLTLGDMDLSIQDESTELTMLNLENPAGLMFGDYGDQLSFTGWGFLGEETSIGGKDQLDGLVFSIDQNFKIQTSIDYWTGEIGDVDFTSEVGRETDVAGSIKAAYQLLPSLALGGRVQYHYQYQSLRIGDYEKKKTDLLGWNVGVGYDILGNSESGMTLLTGVIFGNQDESQDRASEIYHTMRYWAGEYYDTHRESLSYWNKTEIQDNPESQRISAQVLLETDSGFEAGLIIDYVHRNTDEQTLFSERTRYSYYPVTASTGYMDTETVFQSSQSNVKNLGISAVFLWEVPMTEVSNIIWGMKYTSWGSQFVDTNITTQTEVVRIYDDGLSLQSNEEIRSKFYLETYVHNVAIGMGYHNKKNRFVFGWQLEGMYAIDKDENHFDIYDEYLNRYGVNGKIGCEFQVRPYMVMRLGLNGGFNETETVYSRDSAYGKSEFNFDLTIGVGIGQADDFLLDLVYFNGVSSGKKIGMQLRKPL